MVIAVLVLLFLTVIVYIKLTKSKPPNLSDKKQTLLHLCHGNSTQAKRLVEHELNKIPGISFESALDNAIHLLKRDR